MQTNEAKCARHTVSSLLSSSGAPAGGAAKEGSGHDLGWSVSDAQLSALKLGCIKLHPENSEPCLFMKKSVISSKTHACFTNCIGKVEGECPNCHFVGKCVPPLVGVPP